MANPSVTYTFTNGTVADATQMNQNWTDIINSLTDSSKSLNVDAITAAGTATLNGAVNLGNATGDAITVNGAFAGTGGDASATQKGLITTGAQTIAGVKTFNDGISVTSKSIDFVSGYTNGNYDIDTVNSGTNTFQINNSGRRLIFGHDADSYIVRIPPVYDNTSGAAANMYVSSDGTLIRSTSSLRYKTDVTDYEKGLSHVMQLRPVYFKNHNSPTIYAGFIAEEIHDSGLTEFVVYDDQGRPDALHYANMTAILVKSVQEISSKLDAALARIEELENK